MELFADALNESRVMPVYCSQEYDDHVFGSLGAWEDLASTESRVRQSRLSVALDSINCHGAASSHASYSWASTRSSSMNQWITSASTQNFRATGRLFHESLSRDSTSALPSLK